MLPVCWEDSVSAQCYPRQNYIAGKNKNLFYGPLFEVHLDNLKYDLFITQYFPPALPFHLFLLKAN